MPALAHPATKSVPSLQDGDFEAMLQQNVGASQASEPGSDDADADRRCSRHGRPEHGIAILLFCVSYLAQMEVLEDARRAAGRVVGDVRASFHCSTSSTSVSVSMTGFEKCMRRVCICAIVTRCERTSQLGFWSMMPATWRGVLSRLSGGTHPSPAAWQFSFLSHETDLGI
jgi:hypothetical protein